MAFLAPLFLFALAAVAVPLLVHLTHRQRREPVAFPSLMFLRRVEFKTTKRQRLRDRLLFAMRLLALVLLVAAFARPFVSSSDAAPTVANAGRDVVILLDQSFSMRAGNRWASAQAAARRIVDGLGAGDRAMLVRFAARAEAAQQPTNDKGALRAAIDASKPGDETGRYAPALSLARTAISRAARPRRQVVLVTDLQRTGWVPDAELRLPDGVAFDVVDVGEETPANLAVTGVDFVRSTVDGREQVIATARVANRGEAAAERVPVTLALDGREMAKAESAVPANGVAAVRLGPFALPAATVRGEVKAGSDALAGDNVRHFTLDRGRSLGVLLVQDPTASPARTLYLRRALEIGGDPAFRVNVSRDGGPTPAQLADHAVVILDDTRPPRGEGGRRLRDWVAAGGGLVATFGERANGADWTGELAELLPGAVGAPVDRMRDGGGRLGALDRSHPVLEPFAGPRSGNFSAPRFFRHRAVTPAEGVASVARWDDGSVALAERRVGRGRVLAWGSTLDNVWSDLPLQPVFLPLVRQLVQHAAAWDGERPWQTVGSALDLSGLARTAGADSANAEWVVLSPTGRQERLTPRSASLALDEAGVWEVRRFGMRGAPARLVAVNVDPAESDLARVAKAELLAAVAPKAQAEGGGIDAATLTAEEQESRQSLWWFLLLAAALLFAAETVLSNRLRTVGR